MSHEVIGRVVFTLAELRSALNDLHDSDVPPGMEINLRLLKRQEDGRRGFDWVIRECPEGRTREDHRWAIKGTEHSE